MFSFHRLFVLVIAALPWPSAGATHATATNAAELAYALSRDPVDVTYFDLEAGACGAVMKNVDFTELIDAIRAVAVGEHYLSPEVAGTKTHRIFVGQSK